MEEIQPTVKVQDGRLRGKIKVDWQGRIYYSFQGIPYAKPPIGHLRFKAPQPAEPWKGVRDATMLGNASCSRNGQKLLVGSEDCLFLNVYTPEIPSVKSLLKPVMFWIHGGGFIHGSSEKFGPDFLIAEDVVVVTMNFRLGLLGFASFEDPSLEIPGNAGLKDQVLALKWVQRNIDKFCGNPNNVTVFGGSSGSVCAHYLMLSPMAKGLFHRVIAQSGVATSAWAKGLHTAPAVAKALGLSDINEVQIAKILYDMSQQEILGLQEKFSLPFVVYKPRPLSPIVETYTNEKTFLSEEPLDLIKSGRMNQVPLMIGYNSRDGMILLSYNKAIYGQMMWKFDFEDIIPHDLKLLRGSERSRRISERIREYYYANGLPSDENRSQYNILQTDSFFLSAINTVVRYQTASSPAPIYYYRMSVDTQLNCYKRFANLNEAGTCHGDEIGYLFKNMLTPDIRSKSPEDISLRRCIKLWTTFAKYGNPNPIEKDSLITITWPPTLQDRLNFLDIGENLTIGVNPDAERMEFWDELYSLCSVASKL